MTKHELRFARGVGEAVKRQRLAHKWSLRALGKMTGLSAATLSELERGRRNVGLYDMVVIARAFNESVDFFVLRGLWR